MTELEKLKQQLNEISEKVKQLENPKFEVGKWYKRPHNKALLFATNDNGNGWYSGYGFDIYGKWMESGSPQWTLDREIPATDKEVEEALIKEAERRGFKKGVRINNSSLKGCCLYDDAIDGDGFKYYSKNSSFSYKNALTFGYFVVFIDGKWAEIIKDEPIKVGGVDCVVDSCGAWFDKNQYSWEEINSLVKVFKNHSSQLKSINVGCSGQYKVDLELLEKILALKK